MDDGHESDYPEPSTPARNPYPALPQDNASNSSHVQQATSSALATQQNHVSTTSPQGGPLLAEAMRTYVEQAQKYWSAQPTPGFGWRKKSSVERPSGSRAEDEPDVQPMFTLSLIHI